MKKRYHSRSEEETVSIGRDFGRGLRRGDVVALIGTLGSGKTQFVKGVCSWFSVRDNVSSPTFVIMHRYEGVDPEGVTVYLHHVDFYRIGREEELEEIGFKDFVGGDSISLVEWADAFPALLPSDTRTVRFDLADDPDGRTITIGPGPQEAV
jgi:tRNA threonylcarbamoyladenosine biosynthesis protein TsaE